jgi:hypothetical protein
MGCVRRKRLRAKSSRFQIEKDPDAQCRLARLINHRFYCLYEIAVPRCWAARRRVNRKLSRRLLVTEQKEQLRRALTGNPCLRTAGNLGCTPGRADIWCGRSLVLHTRKRATRGAVSQRVRQDYLALVKSLIQPVGFSMSLPGNSTVVYPD